MEVTQVIRCLSSFRIKRHRIVQHQHFFQLVREAVVRTHGFSFLVQIQRFVFLTHLGSEKTQCIIYHRISGFIFFCYKRQQLSSFFIHTCRCIVDGIFQIAVYGTAHQSFHFSLCGSGCFSISLQCMNQIRFETASHIELIHRQRVIDKRLSLRKITSLTQEGNLQLTSFMVQPVAIQRTVNMVKSVCIVFTNHVYLCQAHVARILPCGIPGSLEESIVCTVYVALHFLAPA